MPLIGTDTLCSYPDPDTHSKPSWGEVKMNGHRCPHAATTGIQFQRGLGDRVQIRVEVRARRVGEVGRRCAVVVVVQLVVPGGTHVGGRRLNKSAAPATQVRCQNCSENVEDHRRREAIPGDHWRRT